MELAFDPSLRLRRRLETLHSMLDLEREQLRKTYQLCLWGFAINGVALALACFTSLLSLFRSFDPRLVHWIHQNALWEWIDTPIVWGSLIGTALLWGRWDHVSWQRRSGLLLAMCVVDLAIWFLNRRVALGFDVSDIGGLWMRDKLGQALGWAEFALLSSLSCDYLVHLGIDHARDSDKSTRSMAATGAMVWMLLFCQETNWAEGWPLQPRRLGGVENHLLHYGFELIWAITVIQVTALVVSAARQSYHVLQEMDREDQDQDPLRSRSDPRVDLDAPAGPPNKDDRYD
jgi:hypothetical protein